MNNMKIHKKSNLFYIFFHGPIHQNYKIYRFIILLFILIIVVYLHQDYKRSKKRKYYFCAGKSNLTSINKLAENLKTYTVLIPGSIAESEYILPCGTYQQSRKDLLNNIKKYKNKTFFFNSK